MFNLNKLIQMVKKGELLNRPFNIRKKADFSWDKDRSDDGGNDDWSMEDNPDEFIEKRTGLGPREEEGASWDFNIDETPAIDREVALKEKKIDPATMNMVAKNMDSWIAENREDIVNVLAQEKQVLENSLEHPEVSLIPPAPTIAQAIGIHRGFIDILAEKIKPLVSETPETPEKVNIFINTILAKNNIELFKENQPEEESAVLSDDITQGVLARFLPENLSKVKGKDGRSEYDRVLDALQGKGDEVGKGTGSIYNTTAFTDSVNKMFGVPEGNNLDQRMNFFLTNAELLKNPYFPEGNIFQKLPGLEANLQEALRKFGIVDPDVTRGLFMVKGKTAAAELEDKNSPRSIMTKLLKQLAEPELLEILRQLTETLDPSIVQWFKSQLAYAGKEKSKEFSLDILPTSRGIGRGVDTPDLRATTPEEKEHATLQTGAIIDSYLSRQLETMDMMKDSVVTNLMHSDSDEYIKLKAMDTQTLNKTGKAAAKKQMGTLLKKYTTLEFLNGFATYAVDGIGKMFENEGFANRKKYVADGGRKKNTNILYETDAGRANIPDYVIKDIFKTDKGSKKVTPYDYVKKYIQEINEGKRKDPWTLDWAEAVNYRVPYNMFADMFMVKSQIKEAYNIAQAGSLRERQYAGDVSEEDIITTVYNNIDGYPQSREMLENFAGVSFEERGQEEVKQRKKRNFIKMTLDQTEKNLNLHKSCYEAREKYNKMREPFEENPHLSEEQRRQLIDPIDFEERAGEETDVQQTKMVNGVKEPVVLLSGKLQMVRAKSVLKNIKATIGEGMEPLLPSVLEAIQNSQTTDVMEKLAEKNFIQLFNHRKDRYEAYGTKGAKKNPYDEKGRTNTELYHAITNSGITPKTVTDIGDFLNISKGTKKDKEYLVNLKNLFKSKKAFRNNVQNLRKKEIEKATHIMHYLNPKAYERVLKIKSNPELFKNILKNVPPKEREDFRNKVFEKWDGKAELDNKYYAWLQKVVDPLASKIKIEDKIDKLKDSSEALWTKIKDVEKDNVILEPQTSLNRAFASGSCLRMVYAEYNKALSKIDKLCKIQKFSYKFASVDTSSIDDTILGIEKDFENLLDSLIR